MISDELPVRQFEYHSNGSLILDFLIVYFLEAVSGLKTEKQIMNKNSPVAESQLVPDLGIQTPLLSWTSHCLQPVVESEYH